MSAEKKHDLYAYTTIFKISSQMDLDDFWSYFIFRLNLEKNENTYDRFARLYNLLSANAALLSPSKYLMISLKESCETYILYIETPVKAILEKFIQRLQVLGLSYVYEDKVLSYSIDKNSPQDIKTEEKSEREVYGVYDFIAQSDLEEMAVCIGKMQDGNYSRVYIEEIGSYYETLSHYSSFLQLYPQLNTMNSYISELCMVLSLYGDRCSELGMDLKMLLQSFVNNIAYWQESLFVRGGEELHFMDESFKADLSQIKMSLGLYDELTAETSDECLEGIFDF